jgi:hypothetical protein
MVRYLARELDDQQITALLVYLGWVRTVNMGMGFDLEQARMSEAELNAMTQSPHLPLRAAVLEATGVTAGCGEASDGFVGVHAERAAAVGDDADIIGQRGEMVVEFGEGDGSGAGDVTGGVLRLGISQHPRVTSQSVSAS